MVPEAAASLDPAHRPAGQLQTPRLQGAEPVQWSPDSSCPPVCSPQSFAQN